MGAFELGALLGLGEEAERYNERKREEDKAKRQGYLEDIKKIAESDDYVDEYRMKAAQGLAMLRSNPRAKAKDWEKLWSELGGWTRPDPSHVNRAKEFSERVGQVSQVGGLVGAGGMSGPASDYARGAEESAPRIGGLKTKADRLREAEDLLKLQQQFKPRQLTGFAPGSDIYDEGSGEKVGSVPNRPANPDEVSIEERFQNNRLRLNELKRKKAAGAKLSVDEQGELQLREAIDRDTISARKDWGQADDRPPSTSTSPGAGRLIQLSDGSFAMWYPKMDLNNGNPPGVGGVDLPPSVVPAPVGSQPPPSATEKEQRWTAQEMLADVRRIKSYKDTVKGVDKYLGPFDSTLGRGWREYVSGDQPEEISDMYRVSAKLAALKTKQITGAQMANAEIERLSRITPNPKKHPNVFWQGVDQFERELTMMMEIRYGNPANVDPEWWKSVGPSLYPEQWRMYGGALPGRAIGAPATPVPGRPGVVSQQGQIVAPNNVPPPAEDGDPEIDRLLKELVTP